MRIELAYVDGKVLIGAQHPEIGLVARAEGATVDEAAKKLVSKFAEYQTATIKALNDSGLIRYVSPESMS